MVNTWAHITDIDVQMHMPLWHVCNCYDKCVNCSYLKPMFDIKYVEYVRVLCCTPIATQYHCSCFPLLYEEVSNNCETTLCGKKCGLQRCQKHDFECNTIAIAMICLTYQQLLTLLLSIELLGIWDILILLRSVCYKAEMARWFHSVNY